MKACGSTIRRFPLSTEKWIQIAAPIACSYYMILGTSNGSGLCRCSDENDGDTWYEMPPMPWFSYSCPALYKKFRFSEGDIVTFLKATVPGTVAIVEFYN